MCLATQILPFPFVLGGRHAVFDARTPLPKIAMPFTIIRMSTINISLPDSLKALLDEQVAARGFGRSSEYVRDLIRRGIDRRQLRELLLQGAQSSPAVAADRDYFRDLRLRLAGRER